MDLLSPKINKSSRSTKCSNVVQAGSTSSIRFQAFKTKWRGNTCKVLLQHARGLLKSVHGFAKFRKSSTIWIVFHGWNRKNFVREKCVEKRYAHVSCQYVPAMRNGQTQQQCQGDKWKSTGVSVVGIDLLVISANAHTALYAVTFCSLHPFCWDCILKLLGRRGCIQWSASFCRRRSPSSLFTPAISCSRSNPASYQSTGSAARKASRSSPLLVETNATQSQATGSEPSSSKAEIRWSFVPLPGTVSRAGRFKSDDARPTCWNKFGGSASSASSPIVRRKPSSSHAAMYQFAEVPFVCWTGNDRSPCGSCAAGSTSVSSPRPFGSQAFARKSFNNSSSTCSDTRSLRRLLVLNTREVAPTMCMSADIFSQPQTRDPRRSALGAFRKVYTTQLHLTCKVPKCNVCSNSVQMESSRC